jgi:hypothetical protein
LLSNFVPFTEFHEIKMSSVDNVSRLDQFFYGGNIIITQFPEAILFNGKYHDGIEISTFGDWRDAFDKKFEAKVLPSNEVMIQMPAVRRFVLEEHTQIFRDDFEVLHQDALNGVKDAQAVMRQEVQDNPSLRIRIIVFTFPSHYKLSNAISRRRTVQLWQKVSSEPLTFTGIVISKSPIIQKHVSLGLWAEMPRNARSKARFN